MNAFAQQFKELWKLGGPFAAAMGVVSFVLVEEGARFLLWTDLSAKVSAGEITNTIPFFIQGFGAIALGLLFLVLCLSYYHKMKRLELEKDKVAVSALKDTTETVTKLLEKASGSQLAGQLNLIQTTVDSGNALIGKLIQKNYP